MTLSFSKVMKQVDSDIKQSVRRQFADNKREGIEAVTVTRKDRERFVDAGIVCREDSCAKEYCLKEELNFSIDD